MLAKGLKGNVVLVVFLAAMVLTLVNAGVSEATRRALGLNDVMEKSMTTQRKVEIRNKLYDVIINHTDQTIAVKGTVEDWDEMDAVEKYFTLRSPVSYQLTFDLDLGN